MSIKNSSHLNFALFGAVLEPVRNGMILFPSRLYDVFDQCSLELRDCQYMHFGGSRCLGRQRTDGISFVEGQLWKRDKDAFSLLKRSPPLFP